MNEQRLKQEIYHMHASLCGAVADPNRIMILYELEQGPKYVGELAEALQLNELSTSLDFKRSSRVRIFCILKAGRA